MKKFLILLAVLAIAATLGILGFVLAEELTAPPADALPPDGVSAPASAPSGETEKLRVDVNFMKPVKTAADILSAADYEYSKNRDTVGWLNIPDTKISSAVLQSFDNAYYLRKDERRQENVYGCYFADFTCNFGSRRELSPNTVIYGHSDLRDNPEGPRFSQLFRFEEEEFAKTHPVVYFSTREEAMAWQIFAVFYTDLALDFTRADYDEPGLVQLGEQAKARSLYRYPVEVGAQDRILTLVTCTVKYGAEQKNVRYVLMAKLMPEDWSPDPEIPLEKNPNPVQPTLQ